MCYATAAANNYFYISQQQKYFFDIILANFLYMNMTHCLKIANYICIYE